MIEFLLVLLEVWLIGVQMRIAIVFKPLNDYLLVLIMLDCAFLAHFHIVLEQVRLAHGRLHKHAVVDVTTRYRHQLRASISRCSIHPIDFIFAHGVEWACIIFHSQNTHVPLLVKTLVEYTLNWYICRWHLTPILSQLVPEVPQIKFCEFLEHFFKTRRNYIAK